MTRIYIRAGMSPLEPVSVGDAVQHDLFGLNTGNLVFQYSTFRTLMREGTEFDARWPKQVFGEPGGVERLNETCDFAVFPMADAFRSDYSLKPLTEMIRRLRIPCVVIGCGLKTRSPENIKKGFPFDDDVRAFMDAVLEKSALVGLRGEYTADYLQRLGYVPERHFTVIGCPSLYLNGPVMPEPRVRPIDESTRLSINTRMTQNPALNRLIRDAEARFPDYHLVQQVRWELAMIAYGTPNIVRAKGKDTTGFYPFFPWHRDVRNGRAIGFTEARTWFDYMQNVDYSFGSRIHGNITAMINGVPSYVFTTDTRMEELCRWANINYMHADDVTDAMDIRDILEGTDFTSVCRGYRQRFDHYVDFLDQNGLPHIYQNGKNPERPPLDAALEKLPMGGLVRQGCMPAAEARRRWLETCVTEVKSRLGRGRA